MVSLQVGFSTVADHLSTMDHLGEIFEKTYETETSIDSSQA